ncbi:MAG: carbamoyltransferase C-terminal domain-containing protein, partial [Pseudomonadota bacterium]
AGFPNAAIQTALDYTGVKPEEIEVVAYPFLTHDQEMSAIAKNIAESAVASKPLAQGNVRDLMVQARAKVPIRNGAVHGLADPNQRMKKGLLKRLAYRFLGGDSSVGRAVGERLINDWAKRSEGEHRKWQEELERGVKSLGLQDKLRRYEHHASHAANSYFASGFDRALIVTLDGYGSGLCGAINIGEGGKIQRLHGFPFPYSLGQFYENVTSALGFRPDRHAGKIVGLAAYGDPLVLDDVLRACMRFEDGEFRVAGNFNYFVGRALAAEFPMIDVAAAYQTLLEVAACEVISYWVKKTGCDAVVLSGGVTANVKMNQRIHEIDGVEKTYVYPNMGDGGCGTGLGYLLTRKAPGPRLDSAYLGPDYSEEQIAAALKAEDLEFSKPDNLAAEVASAIFNGKVVARFGGRMEYGPRALGNRSIMYHAKEPEVNQWLNKRLGRTEFMPFAPVTLYEERERCYENLSGAEHAAEFMTITFDCTPWMKENCPAAVHVDGTARPQLIRRDLNPGYYDIVKEYDKLAGVPCLINTSFNMHEEPIVCSPQDAVRAFLDGRLDMLAIGPFLVPQPANPD